ncbi:hypothetical protein E2P71_05380 [Candidatus Bathyarchaeota archaeon]|nr:hypothetical protein E2P71_05380 [Candidatus Bathyarchaeota archaeon]
MRTHKALEEWVNAHKARSLSQLKEMYTEDSSFHRTGTKVITAEDSALKVAEFDHATKTQRSVRPSWIMCDEVRAEVTERSELLEAAGIQEARYIGLFVVRGDKIESVQLEPTPDTRQATDRALSGFIAWASKERPERLAQVMSGERFRYDSESGRRLLKLLREWRESTK